MSAGRVPRGVRLQEGGGQGPKEASRAHVVHHLPAALRDEDDAARRPAPDRAADTAEYEGEMRLIVPILDELDDVLAPIGVPQAACARVVRHLAAALLDDGAARRPAPPRAAHTAEYEGEMRLIVPGLHELDDVLAPIGVLQAARAHVPAALRDDGAARRPTAAGAANTTAEYEGEMRLVVPILHELDGTLASLEDAPFPGQAAWSRSALPEQCRRPRVPRRSPSSASGVAQAVSAHATERRALAVRSDGARWPIPDGAESQKYEYQMGLLVPALNDLADVLAALERATGQCALGTVGFAAGARRKASPALEVPVRGATLRLPAEGAGTAVPARWPRRCRSVGP